MCRLTDHDSMMTIVNRNCPIQRKICEAKRSSQLRLLLSLLAILQGTAILTIVLFLPFNTSIPSSHGTSPFFISDNETFSTFQTLDAINTSIEQHAQEILTHNRQTNQSDDRCQNVMIYLPASFTDNGHASQLNAYLLAVEISTYLGRPLLLLESPTLSIDGGSQFGCPDHHQEQYTATTGLSRLIVHPAWLHRGCPIPCADTHGYGQWLQIKASTALNQDYTCHDKLMGWNVSVRIGDGYDYRRYFFQASESMIAASHLDLIQWAINVGATDSEAHAFAHINSTLEKWDYLMALIGKTGILRFQPWIAHDLKKFIRQMNLPFHETIDAIHVRRGDKITQESRPNIIEYWESQGYTESNMPLNYIPFEHYLKQWNASECMLNTNGELERRLHNVYVATDDPVVVKQEILNLIASSTAVTRSSYLTNQSLGSHATLLYNSCHQFTFYFNPTNNTFFHIHDGDPMKIDTCSDRYNRNIVSMVDLFLLARCHTFIGEFSSNWGILLRSMRVRLSNDNGQDGHTIVLDTRKSWGADPLRRPI